MTTTTKRSSTPPAQAPVSSDNHRNEVVLVGELAAPPQARIMPSGDEVISFRLTVRSAASGANSSRAAPSTDGPSPESKIASRTIRSGKAGKAAAPAPRSDSIDCAVWRSDLRTRVQRYRVGDVLEVTGAVRHRYWRGAAGLASRYEVEVERVRVVVKARAVTAPSAQPATADAAGVPQPLTAAAPAS